MFSTVRNNQGVVLKYGNVYSMYSMQQSEILVVDLTIYLVS